MAPALILIRQNTNRTRQIVACKRSLKRLLARYDIHLTRASVKLQLRFATPPPPHPPVRAHFSMICIEGLLFPIPSHFSQHFLYPGQGSL